MEVRIVAQLAACLDEIDNQEVDIVVIGATTRPESIDQGLRRAGRFEKEIALGVPNEEARIEILNILTKKMRMKPDFDMKDIVKMTPGYVGADISTLCKEASIQAVSRIIHEQAEKGEIVEKDSTTDKNDDEDGDEELENVYIELKDFQLASKRV
jgi:ribosome biogenesis ATPase